MNLGSYPWNCPRDGCKKFIMAYTEGGLRSLVEEHMAQHTREDRQQVQQSTAIALFRPPVDYNTLKVTSRDLGFLKTRGIKIDEKIELDLSIEPKPTKEELPVRIWAEVLERAWKS